MIRRNIFEVSEDEKRRILGLHESAAKRHYLIREQETPGNSSATTTYRYWAVIPSADESTGAGEYVNRADTLWVAQDIKNPDNYYKATPKEKDNDGVPISYDVNTTSVLPKYGIDKSQTQQMSELLFGLSKDENDTPIVDYNYDEKTKNAYIGDFTGMENEYNPDKPAYKDLGRGKRYLVVSLDNYTMSDDRKTSYYTPRIVSINPIQTFNGNAFDFTTSLDWSEFEVNKVYPFNPSVNSIETMVRQKALSKKQPAWFGLSAQKSAGGYPMPEAEGPQNGGGDFAPITIKKPAGEPFEFDSPKLTKENEASVDAFIAEINNLMTKYPKYKQFLQSQKEIPVYAYSSGDGDPDITVPAKNGCPSSSREDYDLCLSVKRADYIVGKLKEGLGLTNFKGYGKGYENPKVPNWTKGSPTKFANTQPNRRFDVVLPEYSQLVK